MRSTKIIFCRFQITLGKDITEEYYLSTYNLMKGRSHATHNDKNMNFFFVAMGRKEKKRKSAKRKTLARCKIIFTQFKQRSCPLNFNGKYHIENGIKNIFFSLISLTSFLHSFGRSFSLTLSLYTHSNIPPNPSSSFRQALWG